ncbi:hypothetical protein [Polaromonas sp.]|uniref:hypothetical protein n=1 Tax=Polaromonas sp. TaxID=1869339 RepID=UPI00273119F2|nr:hypothetical protein [Polaromonas sp.]MDP1886132.1 hypothetical protein [Polaromonas sp.]
MRKIFWKMFPPFEVRLTLEEIERFFVVGQLCGSIIKPRAVALAKDAERTVYSVRIDRMKPDQLALILISNVIGEELQSGAHHVYRGVLGMIGNDMRAVWSAVQRELLARGYCDESEVAKDNEWLSRQIKDAG